MVDVLRYVEKPVNDVSNIVYLVGQHVGFMAGLRVEKAKNTKS